jgi:hypothetical protein
MHRTYCELDLLQVSLSLLYRSTIVYITLHDVARRGGARKRDSLRTRVKIEKINNLLQVDIDRREQGYAAHYEQYCQHAVTALFNCNNLEQHG